MTIKLRLDNFVQLDLLNTLKPDLLKYLRHGLLNSNIMLEAIIATDETSKKMIYTSNDKFKYLAEKYPILEEMKKKFGLDTDY